MSTWKRLTRSLPALAAGAAVSLLSLSPAMAAPLNIKDTPLFLSDSPPPLNMLVMGRDHRMYYEAYNDASDLDGDGNLDVGYKPALVYFGYFDSFRCYTHNGTNFVPGAATANKQCSGQWSGDWLNYVTTSRIDALRAVLYGGLRSTDSTTQTILQRAYIPQDAHSWGKEYTGPAANQDGYDISKYTPLALPTGGKRHLFANTTDIQAAATTGNANPAINGVGLPLLRVVQNSGNRIWDWVSKERPVADGDSGQNGIGVTPTDYVVRVEVCKAGFYDVNKTNCRTYGSVAKPTGLLQDYGENNTMLFGLLSGSYGKPHDGGVLRKAVGSLSNEISASTGQFVYTLDPPGIIGTIDRLRITSFNNLQYDCGWITTSADEAGSCSMWGNPTAEMMYEVLRYFSGKGAPTGAFSSGSADAEETSLGLKQATWSNPYATYASCAKPFETVISDISPSFDSDKVPGSTFAAGFSGDVSGLNASNLGTTIWNSEIGATGNYFIGQSGANGDGAPTVKSVSSFGNIRGLAPEAPGKEGSYNAASVAYYGLQNDLNAAAGQQRMQTFAVALASPLPQFVITVGSKKVTLVPFAKSVGGAGWGIDPTQGSYQPTNQIVDFYVESQTATAGRFRVNFEDVEQGADHDMDAIALYDYSVNNSVLTVTITSEYAAGSIIQHIGYVISGTTQDGPYLVVRDKDTDVNGDPDYFLDTPPGQPPGGNWKDNTALPLTATRNYTPSSTGTASFLKDPLWYAAKWGGFNDSNGNGRPDQQSEWAANALVGDTSPDPDNYFLVTNALTLKDQLAKAFDDISRRSASAAAAAVSSGSINSGTGTRLYEAAFNSATWSGDLKAYSVLPRTVDSGGTVITQEGTIGGLVWSAAANVPAPNSRKIFTVAKVPAASPNAGVYRTGVPFTVAGIGAPRLAELQPASDGLGAQRLAWLRGDRTLEAPTGAFRKRDSRLGDIVDSGPIFVGAPSAPYPDGIESSVRYSTFRLQSGVVDRPRMIYVGANDGMLHAFNEATGIEQFAFIPHGVFRDLYKLPAKNYAHEFYVDGSPSVVDAFFGGAWHTVLSAGLNKGGQSVYALDVTRPQNITESGSAFLWEFTDQQDRDLGYTFSRPSIVKLRNGKWAAVFGNGYNNTESTGGDTSYSTTGNAVLFIVDVETGALIKKIDTGVGTAQDPLGQSRPNGLATVSVIDLAGDGVSEIAYAGDLFGNLWKFDLSSTDPTTWDVDYRSGGTAIPLFVARDAANNRQPITEAPAVTRGPYGIGTLLLFGTGKFLEQSDRDAAASRVQTFYGIYDSNTGAMATDVVTSRASLVRQTVTSEGTTTVNGAPRGVRGTSANTVDYNTKKGWYIDLISPTRGQEGEMQVTDPVLRAGRVLFTTLIPNSDICSSGGRSWLLEMDALSGMAPPQSPFYVDGVNGLGQETIGTRPTIVSGENSDYVFIADSGNEEGDDTPGAPPPRRPDPRELGRQSWRQLR